MPHSSLKFPFLQAPPLGHWVLSALQGGWLLSVSPFQVLGDNSQSVQSPDVADGVAALVGRALDGVGGAGAALVVRESSVRLQGMANRKMEKSIT